MLRWRDHNLFIVCRGQTKTPYLQTKSHDGLRPPLIARSCRTSSMSKRARSTPPPPSAALARLEMLAGSVLDAYGATNPFDKDGEAELKPAPDDHAELQPRRKKVPRSPKAKERSTPTLAVRGAAAAAS